MCTCCYLGRDIPQRDTTRGYPKIVAEASSTSQKRNAPYIIEEPHTSHNTGKPQLKQTVVPENGVYMNRSHKAGLK